MAGEAGTEVPDNTAIEEAAADADFNAGFAPEAAPSPTATPDADEPGAGANPAAQAQAAAAPAEPPKYRQVTEDEWTTLMGKATAIDEIKAGQQSRDDKVFGHIGALKQTIDSLKTAAQTGQPVEILPEDFAELTEQFPELAEVHLKGLTKVLGRLRPGAAGVPKEEIETQIATRTAEVRSQLIDAQLDAVVDGDWRAEVKSPEFKTWFDAQPSDVQTLQASDSLRDASKLMRLFKVAKSAPPAKAPPPPAPPAPPSGRQRLLSAAAPPRGTGAHAPAPSDDDEFNAAFTKGR